MSLVRLQIKFDVSHSLIVHSNVSIVYTTQTLYIHAGVNFNFNSLSPLKNYF